VTPTSDIRRRGKRNSDAKLREAPARLAWIRKSRSPPRDDWAGRGALTVGEQVNRRRARGDRDARRAGDQPQSLTATIQLMPSPRH
jgi:hypothetical protein